MITMVVLGGTCLISYYYYFFPISTLKRNASMPPNWFPDIREISIISK